MQTLETTAPATDYAGARTVNNNLELDMDYGGLYE